jgi:hypothetical protein
MTALTQEKLHELVYYKDGELFYKEKKYRRIMDRPLGHLHHTGYLSVMHLKKFYMVHRLVWLYHHGFMPPMLDHIDGNPVNNRIENLRIATATQNQQNKGMQKNNTSGIKGISFFKPSRKWRAQIKVNGKNIYLGLFDDIKVAENVINKVRADAHGVYARFK